MTIEPKNNGRNTAGQFAEGNSLGGKKIGSRHKVTLAVQALIEGEHELLTRKAVDLALAGDITALRLCLDRLAPARKDSSIRIDLPPVNSARDALDASRATIAAVVSGEITPMEAGQLMALINTHKELIETCELDCRLTVLELKMEKLK